MDNITTSELKQPVESNKRLVGALVILMWLSILLAGMLMLVNSTSLTSNMVAPVSSWPPDSAMTPQPSAITLVVFLSPNCETSSATVERLSRTLASTNGDVSIRAVFTGLSDQLHRLTMTELWNQTNRLSQSELSVDHDGKEASRFGVTSSGHILAFLPDGTRVFSGGIVGGRCATSGTEALSRILRGEIASNGNYPVSGRPILSTNRNELW